MKQAALSVGLVLVLAGGAAAQVGKEERLKAYEKSLIGWGTLGSTFAGAALGEIRNSPSEYGRTTGAFAERWGSRLAQNAVGQTFSLGVSSLHHEDLRYKKSGLDGKFDRLLYAVKSTFVVPKSDTDGNTLALGRFAGAFGGGLVSRTWQPPSVSPISHGFEAGGISIAISMGKNVLKEFWPSKK